MALNRSPEFKGMYCRNSVWVCMRFNHYNLAQHLPCQISSEASGSEEEDFNMFLCISMVQE